MTSTTLKNVQHADVVLLGNLCPLLNFVGHWRCYVIRLRTGVKWLANYGKALHFSNEYLTSLPSKYRLIDGLISLSSSLLKNIQIHSWLELIFDFHGLSCSTNFPSGYFCFHLSWHSTSHSWTDVIFHWLRCHQFSF